MTNTSIDIKIAAPGKVILHGEHSVVYGKLAVAASTNSETLLHLTSTNHSQSPLLELNLETIDIKQSINIDDLLKIVLPDGKLCVEPDYDFEHPENILHNILVNKIKTYLQSALKLDANTAVENALTAFLYLYFGMLYSSELKSQSLSVNLKTKLPLGGGLGSSASFAVSIAAGFVELLKQFYTLESNQIPDCYKVFKDDNFKARIFTKEERQLISRWAFEAERVTHGNPSGLDNTVCTFGGIVEYRKGTPPKQLQFEGNMFKLECLLINTNVPKNTKAQVQKVAVLKDQFPILVGHILDAMEDISKNAIECFRRLYACEDILSTLQEFDKLNILVDANHNMLRSLGVSHVEIDRVCVILEKFKLHTKITGAGGGGYVLCYVPPGFEHNIMEEVKRELLVEGFNCDVLKLGNEGVRNV